MVSGTYILIYTENQIKNYDEVQHKQSPRWSCKQFRRG
jgi:hypothetical protein